MAGIYLVLEGHHVEDKDASGRDIVHKKGDRFYSKKDLQKFDPGKFMKVGDAPADLPPKKVAPTFPQEELKDEGDFTVDGEEVELASLTIAQLKDYAEQNGIDVSGLTKKQDIIDTIEANVAE